MAESSKKRPLNPGSAIVESLKKEHYDEELGSITIHARSVKDILRLVADRFGQIPQRNEQQHLDHFKNAVEASGSTMVATCVLACETLDFEPVANYLRQRPSPSARSESHKKPDVFSDQQAVRDAWNVKYVGPYADMLRATIIHENIMRQENSRIYANYLPIVQSSGMGKSRTVHQVAQTLFTIPLNLREEWDGYPHPDSEIRDWIVAQANAAPTYTKKRRVLAIFLAALFEVMADEIIKLAIYEPARWQKCLEDNVKVDMTLMTRREKLHDDVLAKAKGYMKLLGEHEEGETPRRASAHAEGSSTTSNDPTSPSSSSSSRMESITKLASKPLGTVQATSLEEDVFCLQYVSKMHTALQSLQVKKVISKNSPLLLVLDECHTLTNNAEQMPSSLECLSGLLDALSQYQLMAIYMTTNSNIRRIAWSARAANSARAAAAVEKGNLEYAQGLAPYTEFGFDVCDGAPIITEGTKTINDVCTLEFMSYFGRPLWRSLIDSRSDPRTILNMAQTKLAGGNHIHAKQNKAAQFAIYSARLGLRYGSDSGVCKVTPDVREKAALEEMKQVESHMRVIYAAPSHREYFYSGTPSEPILAEAAGQLMRMTRLDPVPFLANELSPLVEKGQRGELGARVLLTKAHDVAIPNFQDIGRFTLCAQPISFLAFLRALLADKWHTALTKCFPTHRTSSPQSLEKAFEHAVVHFTHFAKGNDASMFAVTNLWKAAARGCAWECPDNMPYFDFVIPVILDARKPLGRDNVTSVCLQIKDRNKATSLVLPTNVDKLMFGDGDKKPWVFIAMHLGVQPPKAAKSTKGAKGKKGETTKKQKANASGASETLARSSTPPQKATVKAEKSPSKVTLSRDSIPDGPATRSTDPGKKVSVRYDLTIIGCSPTVYNPEIIGDDSDTNRTRWAQLLGSKTMIDEHPRKDGCPGFEYIDTDAWTKAMRQTKPWFDAETGFTWAKDAIGPDVFSDGETDERVLVSGSDENQGDREEEDEADDGAMEDNDSGMDVDT